MPYRLPLLKALPRLGKTTAEGFLVAIDTPLGCSYGDVPLWSYDVPTQNLMLEEARALMTLLPNTLNCLPSAFSSCEGLKHPAVRWGVESALVAAFAHHKGTDVPGILGHKRQKSVQLNALVDLGSEDPLKDAVAWCTQGYATLKLKVAQRTLSEEITLIRNLRKLLGQKVVLRIDANRMLSLESAVEMAEGLSKVGIEYFEEPLQDPRELEAFVQKSGASVALDETLLLPEGEALMKIEGVTTLVLKPSRLGSVQKVLTLMGKAQRRNMQWVLTSDFESGVGLSNLANWAFIQQNKMPAMGLSTFSWLKADVLTPPFRPFRAQLQTGLASLSVNLENCEKPFAHAEACA